jgi:hypothetical protein
VEVNKKPQDQGHYLHPELFGHVGDPNIAAMHRPEVNHSLNAAGDLTHRTLTLYHAEYYTRRGDR